MEFVLTKAVDLKTVGNVTTIAVDPGVHGVTSTQELNQGEGKEATVLTEAELTTNGESD